MVLNKYRDQVPEGAVSIMRPGPWGNPYRVHDEGAWKGHGRKEAIEKYRFWLWSRIQFEPEFKAKVAALHGKDLVCCCAPKSCHGHVLERAAKWASETL